MRTTIRLPPGFVSFLFLLGSSPRRLRRFTITFAIMAGLGWDALLLTIMLKAGLPNYSPFDLYSTNIPAFLLPGIVALVVLLRARAERRASDNLARELDPILQPHTGQSAPFTRWGRTYESALDGHKLHIHYHAPNPKRGARAYLGLYLETQVKTRLNIFPTAQIANPERPLDPDWHRLAFDDPALGDFAIDTIDANWSRRFLSVPSVREAVIRLVAGWQKGQPILLVFQPDAIAFECFLVGDAFRWQKFMDIIRGASVGRWLDDLRFLADAVATFQPPSVEAATTEQEQVARTSPGAFPRALVVMILAAATLILWWIALARLLRLLI